MFLPASIRRGIRQILGIGPRNLGYIYPSNPRHHFPLVDDKLKTKELLSAAGIPVPQTLFVVRGFFEVPTVVRKLRDRTDFVIKPSRGRAGSGILVVRGPDGEKETPKGPTRPSDAAIRKHLGDILFGVYSFGGWDEALVEERLKPHPKLYSLWRDDILDVRIILYRIRPVLAMLRVPTRASGGCSNLHAGALGIGLDLATGETRQGFWRGSALRSHPDTGAILEGIRIPEWDRIVAIAIATGRVLPLGYLGIDICLAERHGPVVLEANARPGLEIQNVNRAGLRPLLEKVSS